MFTTGIISAPLRRSSAAIRLISRRQPGACLQQQQHHIGFSDSEFDLAGHELADFVVIAPQSTGVDDDRAAELRPAEPVQTIAGQPRIVGDERVAGTGQAVKECGLADVGATDKGNDRKQRSALLTCRP